MAVDNVPPIDNTRFMRYCRISNSWLTDPFLAALKLPQGTDSVANSDGIEHINQVAKRVDERLKVLETNGATPAPDCFSAVWKGVSSQGLASNASIANPTWTWTNVFTLSGTPSATFNTSTGLITINTAGYWRITYHIDCQYPATLPTEGYVLGGLKESGTTGMPIRLMRQIAQETYEGQMSVFKSVLCRVSTTSGNFDLDTAKTYYLAVKQENSSLLTLNVGGAMTWLAIEYVRPL